MNSLFLLLSRGRVDPAQLRASVARSNERRRKILTRAADLLFGLFMILFGQIKLTGPDGKPLDLSSPAALSADQKLNAILLAQDVTQRGALYRELLRPALVSCAELIASLMEPDEQLLGMLGGAAASPAAAPSPSQPNSYFAAATANPGAAPPAPPVDLSAPPGSQSNPIVRPRGGNL